MSKKYSNIDEYFMSEALKEAEKCLLTGDIPIGAVIVMDGKIVSKAHNQVEKLKNSLAHAEILAINKAIKISGYKHLLECTLYVTLEPCSQCAGAIVLARIPDLVFGAYDPKAGACGSVLNIASNSLLNHRCKTTGGILENQCSTIIKDFFYELRANKKG